MNGLTVIFNAKYVSTFYDYHNGAPANELQLADFYYDVKKSEEKKRTEKSTAVLTR